MTPLVLLTRPLAQSRAFARSLRAALPAHEVLIAPLTEVVALPIDGAALDGIKGLVLTSANALPPLAGHLSPGSPAFCVGAATGRAARAAGLAVHHAEGDAQSLLKLLLKQRPEGPLLHVHGRDLAFDVARALTAAGIACTGVVGYEAREIPWPPGTAARIAAAPACYAPVFSPRAARLLAARLPLARAGVLPVTISEAAALALSPDLRVRARVADTPNAEGLRAELRAAMSQPRPIA